MNGDEPRQHIKWTGFLIARLGLLAGQGMSATEIARDPEFNTHVSTILKVSGNYKLPVSKERSAARLDIRLPIEVHEAFAVLAKHRGMEPHQLMRQVLCICGNEPNLIKNIVS